MGLKINSNSLGIIGLAGMILAASYMVHIGPILHSDEWSKLQLHILKIKPLC
jgi:hypothetical protein